MVLNFSIEKIDFFLIYIFFSSKKFVIMQKSQGEPQGREIIISFKIKDLR